MDLLSASLPTPLVPIVNEITKTAQISLFLKRDELIHPFVSGNKWRKLKYSLLEAMRLHSPSILSFGGAYSNHLYALAAAGKALGIRTVGIVRGEELAFKPLSPTLQFCVDNHMHLEFVTRESYRQRNETSFLNELLLKYHNPFLIPEGGTSPLALQGVAEINEEVLSQLGATPDYYAVACGTGGTAAGLLSTGRRVIAFPVLKGGGFLEKEILDLVSPFAVPDSNLQLITDYHFGGYGKWTDELLTFIHQFKKDNGIQLEQVYTAKMMVGLLEQISKGRFPANSQIVAVHTGGLQGLAQELL